jgi:folate-binding protein YgfZ
MGLRVSAGFCMAGKFARIRGKGPFKTCGKTMLKPLTDARRRTALADLGAVRVQGADAIKFLQGQLSNDTTKLGAEMSLLAGLHNAQGRAIAILRLVLVGPDEVLGILPRELAATVAARLSKFVLRAKAKVSNASADYVIAGVEADGPQAWPAATPGATRREADGSISICVGLSPLRWLSLNPVTAGAIGSDSALGSAPEDRERWRALDVADGIPQVYAATSEAFVAQMLNLDVAGGISFEKGCYTGQEVIARAHYRGKVKRRMQRFGTLGPARLDAGDSGTLSDGRSYKVVDAVGRADGTVEFLAVTPTSAGTDDAALPTESEPAAASAAAETSATRSLEVRQLPLPYDLPE